MSNIVKIVKPLTAVQNQKCLTIIKNVINLIKVKHT